MDKKGHPPPIFLQAEVIRLETGAFASPTSSCNSHQQQPQQDPYPSKTGEAPSNEENAIGVVAGKNGLGRGELDHLFCVVRRGSLRQAGRKEATGRRASVGAKK